MSGNIKRILWLFGAMMSLLIFTGCGKDEGKAPPPPAPAVKQYTLVYTAGANGSIVGANPQTVNQGGSGSTVSAVPDDGYHFETWNDGVITPNRTDSEVTDDLDVTAVFAINQYTLDYAAAEGGAIEGIGMQTVNHGEDGSAVTAVATEHYHFVGWSDGVLTPQRIDRNVTADLELKATFAIDQYTLRYTAKKNGSIDGAGTQTVDYGGDGAAVTAMPAAGYHFEKWSDGVTTVSRTDRKVTGDLELTATFAVNQYTLTYKAAENGSIDGISRQTVTYGGDGSQVTAVAKEHHHFASWSDGVTTAGRIDRKVTKDLTVVAVFPIDQYTLTYTAKEDGSIVGAASQKVDYMGSGSKVTAKAAVGYHFVDWSDGVTTANRIDSKVTADLAVRAGFALNHYTLSYTAGENGTIDGGNPQTVDHGGDGSAVTAAAAKGYHFVSWSDGVTTARRLDSKVSGDLAVSAVFEVNTYAVGGRVSGLVEGTRVVLQNNAGDDLAITANGAFSFVTQLLDAQHYEISVLTQPMSPNQTCTLTNGSGTISGENVNNVAVTCVLRTYTVGGAVSGLIDGDQLVLRNNNADDLVITANGPFTFVTPLEDGKKYEVKLFSPLKRQNWTCELQNASGVLTGMDVTDVLVDCYPKVVLEATAGIRKVKLNWNSGDFGKEVTFNLCVAQEKIPSADFDSCQDLQGGALQKGVNSPHGVIELINDIPHWFQLEASYSTGRKTHSEVVTAIPFGGLNDTGIDWCADDTVNLNPEGTKDEKTESCDSIATAFPGQDAFHGRDAEARSRKLSKTGSGSAGFDFTKMCMSGEIAGEGNCPPNPTPGSGADNWACTRDNVTGLVWEVKTASGLRGQDSTYTWYYPDSPENGGGAGPQSGGSCQKSGCDTHAFVLAVNTMGLCGANDWRLPTRKELLSILDNSRFKPAIDSRYFPNTPAEYYWSSSPYAEKDNFAWEVSCKYGETDTKKKSESNHVRLVRGKTVTFGLNNP